MPRISKATPIQFRRRARNKKGVLKPRRIAPEIESAFKEGKISAFAARELQRMIEGQKVAEKKVLLILERNLNRVDLDDLLRRVQSGKLRAGDFLAIVKRDTAGTFRGGQIKLKPEKGRQISALALLAMPKKEFAKALAEAVESRQIDPSKAAVFLAQKMRAEGMPIAQKTLASAAHDRKSLLGFMKKNFG